MPADALYVLTLAAELVGGVLILGYAAAALGSLATRRSIEGARALVIQGTLAGLSLKLAATLLKTIQIHSWQQIGAFAAILALRTLVKQLFLWERGRLGTR